ncbi:MAG: hypothetical protein ABJG56_14065 [Lentilitoribacter sp.]
MHEDITTALIAGLVALIVSVISSVVGYVVAERRLRAELQLEDSLETAVRHLLSKGWPLRSFDVLKHHLRGFQDDELRQLLVRSGAVAFIDPDGRELWGLLDENSKKLATRDQLETKGLTFNEISGLNQHESLTGNSG